MPMNFFFRVDASIEIGVGHMMRCLSLAEALRNRGANCYFISSSDNANLSGLAEEKGFDVHRISLPNETEVPPTEFRNVIGHPVQHASWLKISWQEDAYCTNLILQNRKADWLIVDHYAIDQNWELAVKPHCQKLAVIDDLADRAHTCDMILDQNLGREFTDYDNLLPDHTSRLIGPRYALLRPEFSQSRRQSLKRRAKFTLNRLLVTFGGIDKNNATGEVLRTLLDYPLPRECEITVVMGPSSPHLQTIRHLAEGMPWPTEVKVGVGNMAELMANMDLAIGAAGITSWERCCVGLPSITVIIADNQSEGARALRSTGASTLITDASQISVQLIESIDQITRGTTMKDMSEAAVKVTDGQGVVRVVNHLIGST